MTQDLCLSAAIRRREIKALVSGESSGRGEVIKSTVGGVGLTNVVVPALCIRPLKYLVQLCSVYNNKNIVSLKLDRERFGELWGRGNVHTQ